MDIAELYNKNEQDVFGIQSNVALFITKPLNRQDLLDNWQAIRNDIADLQRTIEDEFERWNYYLFYLAEEDAMKDITLKYKIEHDTISSRKIVISAKEYSENDFKVVIERYIKYTIKDVEIMELHDFSKNTEVEKLIKRKMI